MVEKRYRGSKGADADPRYAGVLGTLHVKKLACRFSPVHHQSPSSSLPSSSSSLPSTASWPRSFFFAMSWKLGKKSPKPSSNSLSTDGAAPARSTTPTPGNPHGRGPITAGLLTIDVSSADGLGLPAGVALPPAVQGALSSAEAQIAQSVSPSSVAQQRLAKVQRGHHSRDSVQRVQCWWLPYIVMEFDVNQVLITPLGGSLENPVYMYPAHL